jgi:hypothetical protein
VPPDALGQPTLHLSIDEVAVQDVSAVIYDHIAEDLDLAGLGIDLNYCYVGTGRERGVWWGEVASGGCLHKNKTCSKTFFEAILPSRDCPISIDAKRDFRQGIKA